MQTGQKRTKKNLKNMSQVAYQSYSHNHIYCKIVVTGPIRVIIIMMIVVINYLIHWISGASAITMPCLKSVETIDVINDNLDKEVIHLGMYFTMFH